MMNAQPFLPKFRPFLETLFAGWHGSETASQSLTQVLFAKQARRWTEGDWAVYRKSKRSTHPGRRACEVKANQKGETYAMSSRNSGSSIACLATGPGDENHAGQRA